MRERDYRSYIRSQRSCISFPEKNVMAFLSSIANQRDTSPQNITHNHIEITIKFAVPMTEEDSCKYEMLTAYYTVPIPMRRTSRRVPHRCNLYTSYQYSQLFERYPYRPVFSHDVHFKSIIVLMSKVLRHTSRLSDTGKPQCFDKPSRNRTPPSPIARAIDMNQSPVRTSESSNTGPTNVVSRIEITLWAAPNWRLSSPHM